MTDVTRPARPIHRNINIGQIIAYRLPPAGVSSILHRISGILLFLSLPFVLYLLDRSLTSVGTFAAFKGFVSHFLVKLVILALIWAYLHHFLAGIRHLFMDVHLGLEKNSTNVSALAVMGLTAVLWVAFALKIFGVF